jgi:hypothetical protein
MVSGTSQVGVPVGVARNRDASSIVAALSIAPGAVAPTEEVGDESNGGRRFRA